MHIGIDCRLPFYQMGGISQYVLHLLPALAELDKDNTYTIFQSRQDGRSHTPLAPNFRRANLWTPCHHRLERIALAAELLPHRLDVFHSPDFIPPAFGAQRRIITIHDLNFHYYPQFLTAASKRYYADQIQWAVQTATHISADSEATRQDLIKILHVPPPKVTTIHLAANPLYTKTYADSAVNKTLDHYNIPRGFILFVGTLEPRKNIPTLLRAYALLRQATTIDSPLLLIGSKGWLFDEIFATIDALALRPHVRHLSGIFDEQLAHFYQAAALLATPSHYEGFGLPALEAMHCGCPVIVSNRGSLPEVVGEAGILLDPDDVRAWAEAMAQVITSADLRARLVVKGRLQAPKFSWPQTAAATLDLYLP